MKDKHGLSPAAISTSAWGRFAFTKKVLVNCIVGVQIDRPGNMSTVVLILETTVNDDVGLNLR